MKRSFLFALAPALALCFSLAPWAARSLAPDDDAAASLQVDHALAQAFARKDKSALDGLLDSAFTWIDSDGQSLSKAQLLENLPALESAARASSGASPQARTYGNVAVIRGGRDRLHTLRVWVKREAGWRALLYQQVLQVEKSEPPVPARAGAGGCENPCKSIPFEPETKSEKEAIASWQGVMRAMADNDADAYAPLIADEFTATDTHHDRPYTKEDRLAQIKKQKLAGARSAPPELLTARMFDFGDAVMMIAREQRPGARAYFNTRMWVSRDGRWQMLFSFNTRIE